MRHAVIEQTAGEGGKIVTSLELQSDGVTVLMLLERFAVPIVARKTGGVEVSIPKQWTKE